MPRSRTFAGRFEAQNKRFVAAVEKADTAAIGALYTDDAQALPPNSDVVKGRAAIQEMWKGVSGSGVAGASLEAADVTRRAPGVGRIDAGPRLRIPLHS